ncbi:CLUMA_CG019919, isoform A [Clunio marinus]|uniref:CLUMA_CG019919, isoform A n=1 Tax=Clunio marinus TaxID=568069 RepID=A0A1J1J1Z5_9DIPT|nr:CLUMA_CG019919, isoform A [Clunio marinus]
MKKHSESPPTRVFLIAAKTLKRRSSLHLQTTTAAIILRWELLTLAFRDGSDDCLFPVAQEKH